MEDLSLHILDVVENSTRAGATLVEIRLVLDEEGWLVLQIRDNGRGMDQETAERAIDPFVTSRATRRVGMGLSLLAQAAEETGGRVRIRSRPGEGTEVTAKFKADHIDMRPLGDLGETMVALILGNPDVDFVFESDYCGGGTRLDTREIRRELGGVPITAPEVLSLIRDLMVQDRRQAEAALEKIGGRSHGEAQGRRSEEDKGVR